MKFVKNNIMEFNERDKKIIIDHGLSIEEVNRQIEILRKGMNYIELIRPATINNGIIELDDIKKIIIKTNLKRINIFIRLKSLYQLLVRLLACLKHYINI